MGFPSRSSSILKSSLPPQAGSARRSRMIESRTQNTNCLYFPFVISVSSIQNPSTLMPRASAARFQTESALFTPTFMEPRSTRTIPQGVGSAHEVPPMPVTSPPADDRLPVAHEESAAARAAELRRSVVERGLRKLVISVVSLAK